MIQTTNLQWIRLAGFNTLPFCEAYPTTPAAMLSSLFTPKLKNSVKARCKKETTAQPLLSVCIAGEADNYHISGNGDNLLVSFAMPASAGWVLRMSSDYQSIELPESYAVPPGMYNVLVPFVSSPVHSSVDTTIRVSLNGQTITAAITVLPRD